MNERWQLLVCTLFCGCIKAAPASIGWADLGLPPFGLIPERPFPGFCVVGFGSEEKTLSAVSFGVNSPKIVSINKSSFQLPTTSNTYLRTLSGRC
jgi:hypothetical protein